MTACCCRLTQPETSRSRKKSGRDSEFMAGASRSEASCFKCAQVLPGGQIRIYGTALSAEYSHSTGLRNGLIGG